MIKVEKILFAFMILWSTISNAQNNKKVLIIGIDGCRPDALQIANTPNLDNLISNGIYSPDALNDDITISGPGWSANLCGVWSNKHQVTDNTFFGDNYLNYPPVTKYIDDQSSNFHTVSICNWNPINDYIIGNYADFKLNVSSDQDVSDQASNYLSLNDPDFMFLHFDDVDHAGHSYGFSPNIPEYISAIEGVDFYIGPIIQAISQRPNYTNEDWLILVTTDHGGLGYSHGGNSMEEENVFVIASGNSIPTQVIYKDSSVVIDSAINCLGDTVDLQFDGSDDYVQINPNAVFDFGALQDFTIECRVRTNISADVAIVGNKDWFSGNNKGFVFSFKYPSGPEWKVNIGDGFNRADINTGGAIADDQWHTLSVTFDRDGFMKTYQDGVLLDSADISSVGDISTGQGLFFGSDIYGDYDFTGSLAEVRIWDNILDNSSIMTWHCSHLDNTHPYYNNLIGYWKLNEGTGVNAIDYSSLLNNGNINGATWNFADSIILYDFSSTPRIVDVPVTALTHLCIPIDSIWDLDGISLIPDCLPSGNKEEIDLFQSFEIFPNPAIEIVRFKFIDNYRHLPMKVEVIELAGKTIKEQFILGEESILDVSDIESGVYLIRIKQNDHFVSKKLIIHR